MSNAFIAFERSDEVVYGGSALIKALQGATAYEIVRDQTAPFDGCCGWKNHHWHNIGFSLQRTSGKVVLLG